jgi:hypothetical protein
MPAPGEGHQSQLNIVPCHVVIYNLIPRNATIIQKAGNANATIFSSTPN